MAYTRPASNAANLAWAGLSAYTRPAASGADLSFVQGSTYSAVSLGASTSLGTPTAIWHQFGSASGFAPGQFGSPTNRLSQPAAGFGSTQIGAPAGYKLQRALGFTASQIGAPSLRPAHVAPWPVSTQFGTSVGAGQYWVVAWALPGTRYGTPTTRTDRTCAAAGWHSTRVGTPTRVSHLPVGVGWTCGALGFLPTGLGVPTAAWLQTPAPVGFAQTALGAPSALLVTHTVGVEPQGLGTPQLRIAQRAAGFKPPAPSVPIIRLTLVAHGFLHAPRFGLPSAERSNAYKTYGVNASGRFGQPKATCRFNYRATGATDTRLGTPLCRERHLARHLAPGTAFGHPLLQRNLFCERTLKAVGSSMALHGVPVTRLVQPAAGSASTLLGTPTT